MYHSFNRPIPHIIMEAFLVSTLAIAVGEIGDKTQLLALLLAARYKKPIPIVLGILVGWLARTMGSEQRFF